jgi:AI-2 transport protein TqsA
VLLVGLIAVYSGVRSLACPGPQAMRLQTGLDPLVQAISDLTAAEGGEIAGRALDAPGLETLIRQIVLGLLALINQFGLVAIYVAFLLVDQTFFPDKLKILFPDPGRRRAAAELIVDLARQIDAYLWIMTKVSGATAALSFLALSLMGLESPVFWAILIFLLNFIPTIGSILGVLLPAAFALAQFQDVGLAGLLAVLLGIIQFTIGNVVLPRLAGDTLNLSLTVTMLCLFFRGALRGVTGMFLAVPLTAILLLVAARFDTSRPIAVALSRTACSGRNRKRRRTRDRPDDHRLPG